MASSLAEDCLDLKTLCNELQKVKHKAYEIGIQLGIDRGKLLQFKQEGDLFSAVLDYWQRKNITETPATWSSIVAVLESEYVDEPGLAAILRNKYCSPSSKDGDTTPGSPDSTPLNSDVEEDLEQQLKQNLEKIMLKYANYVDRIQSIIQRTGVSAKELSSYLLKLPVFIKSDSEKKLTLLSDLKNDLKKADDVTDVFDLLGEYVSFIDYNIFEMILKKYGTSEDQKELDYPEHLKSYIEGHKVKEFIKLHPTLINPKMIKLAESSKTVNIKLSIDRSRSLSTLKEITRAVAGILGVRASTLRLYGVKKGCVLVTLILPSSVAEILFTCETKFTPQQQSDFQTASVLWLQCNGFKFHFSEGNLPSGKLTTTELGPVEKVRKQLMEIYSAKFKGKLESVGATPLHSAVESCDTENVRNLMKGTELKLQPQHTKKIKVGDRLKTVIMEHVKKLYKEWKKVLTTPLHRATEAQDIERVREVLGQAKYYVNCTDSIGWTPLHYACTMTNLDMVTMLISEFGASISISDEFELTPLDLAAFVGDENLVDVLLSKYDCPLDSGALIAACAGGHGGVVRLLIHEYKADVHARLYIWVYTPLHAAAACGKGTVALSLITEFNGDVKAKDEDLNRSLLHSACFGGDVDLVRTLIFEHGAEIEAVDNEGCTPLHVAAIEGRVEVAFALIEEFGCNTKVKGLFGRSLLHFACIGGNVTLVKKLVLQYKADIDARDDFNGTPLHLAALEGNEEVALALISEFGCDITGIGAVGRSVLHSACNGGSVNLVRTLILDYHADINTRDSENTTPLQLAALSGKHEIVLTLLSDFGGDVTLKGTYGRSLLHYACQGDVKLVQTLTNEYCMDINARDDDSTTPVHIAAACGKRDIVMTLIKLGCDTKVKGKYGRSLLQFACSGGNVALVQTLIREHNGDINGKDDEGSTPLHLAAVSGNIEVVLDLIDTFGCDTKVRGGLGRSLLHYACQGGSVELVRTLMQKCSSDVLAKDAENCTPLHVAALYGRDEVVFALINDYDCDITIRGAYGRSLLHLACNGGSISLVRTLIREYNADVNDRDDENNTPLHIAALNGCDELVLTLIKEFSCDITIKGCNGRSLLHVACSKGSIDLVRSLLLEYKADMSDKDDESNTPLHIAALSCRDEMVLTLISEFHCDVEVKGIFGMSLLHIACKKGRVTLFKL